MNILISLFVYFVELMKYWIGNKFFFNGKIERPWIALIGVLVVLGQVIGGNLDDLDRHMIPVFCATVVGASTLDGKIQTKIVRLVWLFMTITSLDSIMALLYGKLIKNESSISILSIFTTVIIFTVMGCFFSSLWKKQQP